MTKDITGEVVKALRRATKPEIMTKFASPFGKEGFDTLRISVSHGKAGYGGIDWTYRAAGHRIIFSPCTRTEYGFTSILMGLDKWDSGFYIHLDQATRKNPHYIVRAVAAMESMAGELTEAYETRNLERLRELTAQVAEIAAKKNTI